MRSASARLAATLALTAACHAALLSAAPSAAFAQPAGKAEKASVSSLIQRGSALFDDAEYEESIQTLSAALLRPGSSKQEKAEIYRLLAYNYIVLKRMDEADAAVRGLYVLDETYSRTHWLSECAAIRCPVLVIAGSEDGFPTEAMSRGVAATIPGARLHVVAGGPHFPNRSHRAEVQAVIAEFFEAIGLHLPR